MDKSKLLASIYSKQIGYWLTQCCTERDELEKALRERNSIESDQRTVYYNCFERIMEIGRRLGAISDIWIGVSVVI